jgi:hypothetical protein
VQQNAFSLDGSSDFSLVCEAAIPRPSVPRLLGSYCAGAALLIVAACVTPTDACGCVALPSVLRVVGTVRDSRGDPVAGAQVSILNRPVGFPNTPFTTVGRPTWATDSLGYFFAETSSPVPGRNEIRASVVRWASSDTVVLDFGVAELRPPAGRVDTLRVAAVAP